MPDRKGFPHPCGSAAPSLARTLCSQAYHSFPVGLNHCCYKIERNVRQEERVGGGSDSVFYSQLLMHWVSEHSLRRYKKEGMAGSGVKRPPHGQKRPERF